MHLLITGGDTRLARAVCTALSAEFHIRAVDTHFTSPSPHQVEAREGELYDADFIAAALEGVDVVLHLAPIGLQQDAPLAALDRATRGTYVLTTRAIDKGVQRLILGSTLDLFDRLPAAWNVDEGWRPRPEPSLEHLCPWLAELSVRECVRAAPIRALCLRFGRLVDDIEAASQPYDPRWLHLDDAVAGIRCALTAEINTNASWIFHITAAGRRSKIRLGRAGGPEFGYQPSRDFQERWETRLNAPAAQPQTWQEALAPPQPIRSRPIRNVVIFGAGGPVAAALAQELAASYTLRLTDVRAIAEIAAEGSPQFHGAPLPVPLNSPHSDRVVDVRDAAAVEAACEGMDAIINCTVVRQDPAEAFRVNTLGAFNIMRAAVTRGIRRVVHTGPAMVLSLERDGYAWDYDLTADTPARPGRDLYIHSKYLGQEVCRVFADHYDLELPVLLFCEFLNPATKRGSVNPFAISWQDSARALRRALETSRLPSAYEVLNIGADLPHGKYDFRKARAILDWEPRDSLERFWNAPPGD